MNVTEANAVNVVVRALTRQPDPYRRQLPTVEQQQDAVDVLLAGAYRTLSAGLRPGDATIGIEDHRG